MGQFQSAAFGTSADSDYGHCILLDGLTRPLMHLSERAVIGYLFLTATFIVTLIANSVNIFAVQRPGCPQFCGWGLLTSRHVAAEASGAPWRGGKPPSTAPRRRLKALSMGPCCAPPVSLPMAGCQTRSLRISCIDLDRECLESQANTRLYPDRPTRRRRPEFRGRRIP